MMMLQDRNGHWCRFPYQRYIELVQSLPSDSTGQNPGSSLRSDPNIDGRATRSAIDTLVDRTSRYAMLLHLPDGYTPSRPRRMGGEEGPARGAAGFDDLGPRAGRTW